MCKIFAIYPTDEQESTKFLNKINTYLSLKLKDDWHCFKIGFDDNEHKNCIKESTCCSAKLILFMGHGRSDRLFGSIAKESHEFISQDAAIENKGYYKNESFINQDNINLFKDKIFFSFSCFSNRNDARSIGRFAINNGVKSFIGFGDIPTDYIKENNIPKKAIATFKGIITSVIKKSLYVSINDNLTVCEMVDLIKILVNKEIQNILLSGNKDRHIKIIVDKLFLFKNEIVILGNRYERVI